MLRHYENLHRGVAVQPCTPEEHMIERFLNIGRLPVCNQKPRRAPHLFNFCFPLCWRCSSILFSMVAFRYILQWLNIRPGILIGMLLLIPCAADGTLQYYFYIESSNTRRIMTGLLAGMGLTIIAFYTRCFFKAP